MRQGQKESNSGPFFGRLELRYYSSLAFPRLDSQESPKRIESFRAGAQRWWLQNCRARNSWEKQEGSVTSSILLR